MAGQVVDVTLRLIDRISSPLNAIGGRLANSANQWTKAGKQIENAGKNISKVGSGMTKSLTVPIASAGVACIKLASDFEKGMSTVQSVSGATGEELDALSKKAREMGAQTKFTATEATEAYKYMAMAGWDAGQMMDGIEGVMYLAGATGEDLASTSDIVTDALTAFGMSAKDTQEFVDVLAQTANRSNTDVAMLGESFKYVAPVAGALKYSVQDVSTALGLMANNGIKASTAGTSMRSWLSRMAAPTDAVEGAMKKLGISLTDSQGNMKSLKTVMADTRSAFAGLTESQKAQYASILAGKQGMSGLLAIVNSSDGDFNKLSDAINNSSGACKNMYDVANDNLQGQLTILKSTLESIAISFGNKLTPYVKTAVKWLQSLASKFNSLSDAQQNTIIKVAGIVAAIGPAILIFGKVVGIVGKVVKAVGAVGKAFKTFGSVAGILTSPAGIVIGVLALIAVGAYLIYKNWDKLKPTFEKVKEAVMSMVKKAMPTIKSLGKTMAKVVSDIVKAAKNLIKAIMPTIQKIMAAIKKAMPSIKKTISSAFKAIMPVIKMAIQLFQKIAGVVGKVLGKAIKAITPVIKKLGDMFAAVFPKIVSVVSGAVKVVAAVIKSLQPVFKVVFSVIGSVVEHIGDTISNVFAGVMKVFGGIIDFITGIFTGNWKKAWEGVKSIFSGIFSTFAAIVKAPINAIISVINGVIKGFNKIKIPDWVPAVGGKGINIPLIPKLAKGTDNWKGGIAQISERGGEIVDLPQGSRVYPHDKSVQKAYADGAKASGGNVNITIPKLADQITVRSEADIDKIAQKLADKLEKVSHNLGGGEIEYLY